MPLEERLPSSMRPWRIGSAYPVAAIECSRGTEIEIVRIDSLSDGILSIGNYLASSAYDFDAVHIVTHGNAEGFQSVPPG